MNKTLVVQIVSREKAFFKDDDLVFGTKDKIKKDKEEIERTVKEMKE